jgi:hypothetical protein
MEAQQQEHQPAGKAGTQPHAGRPPSLTSRCLWPAS